MRSRGNKQEVWSCTAPLLPTRLVAGYHRATRKTGRNECVFMVVRVGVNAETSQGRIARASTRIWRCLSVSFVFHLAQIA